MVIVRADEFRSNPDLYRQMARCQPVIVTRDGQEETVLISAEEYRRLMHRDREALRVEELSEEEIEAIERAEIPAEYSYLDKELGL